MFELARDLAQHVDRLGLERLEVVEDVRAIGARL